MDIPEHVIDGKPRLHIIVGDPIAQVKSPSALTPVRLAPGHNSVVVPVHISKQLVHAARQQMLVDFMLGR